MVAVAELMRVLPNELRRLPELRSEMPARRLVVGLAMFSAVTAIAGGLELVIWRNGNRYQSLKLLEHTPFATFLLPGLMLAFIVGGTSLASAILAVRRSRVAADVTTLAGGGLSVWIL